MKKILFIYKKAPDEPIPEKQQHHVGWVDDCKSIYNVKYWGYGFSDTSLQSLNSEIDSFKPDFIYMTMRKRYLDWLPDLTNIKVPKIYVEVDSYKCDRNDPWYDQFDKILCRQAWWKSVFYSREKDVHPKFAYNSKTWNSVPVFKWSVPEKAFPKKDYDRSGVFFLGAVTRSGYTDRKMMYQKLKAKINFRKIMGDGYWKLLHHASALVCPTESNFGAYVPSKLFEFAASGAAVITNCDLDLYGMPELKPCLIHYTDLNSLEKCLKTKFRKFYGKALPIMRQNTHIIRYKELFGE